MKRKTDLPPGCCSGFSFSVWHLLRRRRTRPEAGEAAEAEAAGLAAAGAGGGGAGGGEVAGLATAGAEGEGSGAEGTGLVIPSAAPTSQPAKPAKSGIRD